MCIFSFLSLSTVFASYCDAAKKIITWNITKWKCKCGKWPQGSFSALTKVVCNELQRIHNLMHYIILLLYSFLFIILQKNRETLPTDEWDMHVDAIKKVEICDSSNFSEKNIPVKLNWHRMIVILKWKWHYLRCTWKMKLLHTCKEVAISWLHSIFRYEYKFLFSLFYSHQIT